MDVLGLKGKKTKDDAENLFYNILKFRLVYGIIYLLVTAECRKERGNVYDGII